MFDSKDSQTLKKLGVENLLDLLLIAPSSYIDYTLSDTLRVGEFHTLRVEALSRNYHPKYLKLNLSLLDFDKELEAIVFHPRKYHYEEFKDKNRLYIYAKLQSSYNRLQLIQPQIVKEPNIIVSKYKSRVSNNTISLLIDKYLRVENFLKEGLDEELFNRIKEIHHPSKEFVKEFNANGFSSESLYALKYIEIFNHLKKLSKKKIIVPSMSRLESDIDDFISSLPFKLTDDQLKVIDEIRSDLKRDIATKRVIMGDVGSGKSIVIFASAMIAREKRSLLMAPTTVLASQLFSEAKRFLPDLKITLVTNKSKKDEDLSGYDFIIGTHALLYRDLPRVDLVMVDEQHRFGTKQRSLISKLVRDGKKHPHYLQFSATPIPRTLSMINSSIIDLSVIKQMPYKKDIDTKIITKNEFFDLIDHIKDEISKNKQIIVVYPLVEESEVIDYQSIEEARDWWEKRFENLYVTYGKDKDKEEVLKEFRDKGDILLATTLIEVGISLPRLSTIVLVAPERLGLATLHQLRGRVSRNGGKGYCFLYTKNPDSKRLKEFCKTLDGFKIAELDLKFREGGDLLKGDIQSGKQFKFFDLKSDEDILLKVKDRLSL